MDNIKFAQQVKFNEKAESEAVEYYTDLLESVKQLEVDENIKMEIINMINEIIADELNHTQKLFNLYISLTKIKPNID